MSKPLKYTVFLFAFTLLYACIKKETVSKIPEIEYKSFFPYQDESADFTITFSDGDGNIGKEQGDSTKNFFLVYYYKDSITHKYVSFDSLFPPVVKSEYTMRKPGDDYKNTPISGEITVNIAKYRHSVKIKNIKYVVYIKDNADNKSNVITTPEISVP